MKLFTPGPVNIRKEILEIGGMQHPYFRTKYFSQMNLESEEILLDLIDCKKGRIVPLTASGSGAMDAVLSNFVDSNSNIMIINAGTFGQRWCDICDFYKIKYYEYKVPFGKNIDLEDLFKVIESQNISHLLMQATETSSGQSMPVKKIGQFLKDRNVLFVVDAITAFMADEYRMDQFNIDITVLSSQKGFAVPPGFSFLVLNEKAVKSLENYEPKSFYFNVRNYVEDMKRGQTPFSPAITLLAQINAQLKHLREKGVENHLAGINKIAIDFRNKVKSLPFDIISENPSNCITGLRYNGKADFSAYNLFYYLLDKYEIYVTPVGGKYSETDIRVSHLGDLTEQDNDLLISKIQEYLNEHR